MIVTSFRRSAFTQLCQCDGILCFFRRREEADEEDEFSLLLAGALSLPARRRGFVLPVSSLNRRECASADARSTVMQRFAGISVP